VNRLERYIREYVKSLYDLKATAGAEDYQWKHPSDVEHPIDMDNYSRLEENKSIMKQSKLRQFIQETIKELDDYENFPMDTSKVGEEKKMALAAINRKATTFLANKNALTSEMLDELIKYMEELKKGDF
jgi:hypothetical protein